MTEQNKTMQCDLGMVGLGVMGKNLLLNMSDHGFAVAGFDIDNNKVAALAKEARENIFSSSDVTQFIASLRVPRSIMILVPAGIVVDIVIQNLLPHLQPGDLIIDGGNSHFIDTDRRAVYLKERGLHFLGVGISGGEEGARTGPSIMPGGPKEAYERVRPIFEAVAARVKDVPCVTYLGTGSAGHYVKMVHNGIEYGLMQLIAETYDLMKRSLLLDNEKLHDIYQSWNNSELNSYLLEITATIFKQADNKTGKSLIDEIIDVAEQNNTGMWTSQSSMDLQMPVPTIDAAVTMRDMSVFTKERAQADTLYQRPVPALKLDPMLFIAQLQHALYVSMIITYAQGMSLLTAASTKYSYGLDLEAVAEIWRGGCIIRAKLLEIICQAYRDNKKLTNLLLDPTVAHLINEKQEYLRQIVSHASHIGIAAPGMMASLGYLDALRSKWSPANLIQAQRDYFGAHTYQRIDQQGKFHTEWGK